MAAGTLEDADAPSALFRHLNAAAWNVGLQIDVAAGTQLAGPVVIRIHSRGAATLPRVLFRVGAGASATLVEQHVGGGAGQSVISRSDIWEQLYDFAEETDSNVIDVFVTRLRKKLEAGGRPRIIHTRRGLGYMLGKQ